MTLSDDDLLAFGDGVHTSLAGKLGGVLAEEGAHFSVWAPNAQRVEVVGDFNGWNGAALSGSDQGVFRGYVPQARAGELYKFRITSADGSIVDKSDPYALACELPPQTASRLTSLAYEWSDHAWMEARRGDTHPNHRDAPISIYELHPGSWMTRGYRAMAEPLADHVTRLGFTHVELMPVMEHPFYGSWGYQVTGYFAPTARYGPPTDLMYLIDVLHQRGIGVILDWVPAHFPTDAHGLGRFDGTALYEHEDPRKGFHPDWTTYIFNYGRNEVQSFLLSSAHHWLRAYHVDGLRVDGVASMLYLDYSREEGEWIPNEHGGNENLEAVAFLKKFNESIYAEHEGVQTYAEESTAWPGVSKPTYDGGLGFGFKWDMGFMHDTLSYFREDPVHRRHHHDKITFRSVYAFSESFVLPYSHDEVVHGKGSMLRKLPGDQWQQRANLRLLLAHQWTTPGKKLLFMGAEYAHPHEWNHDALLDAGDERIALLLSELNALYRMPAMHHDLDEAGFSWISADDRDQSVLVYRRTGVSGESVIVALNFTPVVRERYTLDRDRRCRLLLNTDDERFGGSGVAADLEESGSTSDRAGMLTATLPPLAALVLEEIDGR